MNSSVISYVVGLYVSLLKDFAHLHPSIPFEIERSDRLVKIVKDRKLGFFTITLPDVCKMLERALADGHLPSARPPFHGAKSCTDARPRFLWGLWSMVFDEDGMLWEDASVEAVIALRQLYLFAKKLELECSDEKTNKAISELVEVDGTLPLPHPRTWDDDIPEWMPRHGHPLWGQLGDGRSGEVDLFQQIDQLQPSHHVVLPEGEELRVDWERFGTLCRIVTTSLGQFDSWSIEPKHGPGAVSDRQKVKHELPHWPVKLGYIFPPDWFASTDMVDRTVTVREIPCRVFSVPKTQKAPRIIACEPSSYQWIQGGIQRWFRDGIRRSRILHQAIDLNNQEPSRVLALQGSETGHLATVDLSAASDRLSCRLVEFVFQANRPLLDGLHASRSRLATLPSGEVIHLRKFAMMGSACTFPVQSIVFTCIALWALHLANHERKMDASTLARLSANVRVYGDDIILPAKAYGILCGLLGALALKVNPNKSFGIGLFRESCGMDAFKGVDVTPAYFLQPYNSCNPESLASVVACSNNFHRKLLWNAAAFLAKTVDESILSKVAVSDRDVCQPYLHSYCGFDATRLRRRWNKGLQRVEFRVATVTSKVVMRTGSGYAALLQWFTTRTDPLEEYSHGSPQRPKVRLNLRWASI